MRGSPLVEGLRWRGEQHTDLFTMEARIRDVPVMIHCGDTCSKQARVRQAHPVKSAPPLPKPEAPERGTVPATGKR